MSYDIFLSYSHSDLIFARKLHRRLCRFRLKGRLLRVFFAPTAIEPGESIPRALSQALRECQHLVVLITPSWVESEWCRLEHEASIWLDPGATDRRLLPCLVVNTNVPPELARLSYIDFRDPKQFEEGLRVLVSAVRANELRRMQQHEAVLAQRAVLHAPLLPWIGFGGPSFDFLWPEMIVDPAISTRRHPGPGLNVSEWLGQERTHGENLFAVVGDPGAGKTTMLRSLLLAGGRRLPAQRVLVHARELLQPSHALERQINHSEPAGLALLVDGLDEAGAENIGAIADRLSRIRRDNTFVVLAARTDFFDRQYDRISPYITHFVDVLELQPWEDDAIREFAVKYSQRVGDSSVSLNASRIIKNVPGARGFMSNPMRLTLVLFLLASGLQLETTSFHEPYTLYSLFYEEWLRKERQRGTGAFDPNMVRKAHVKLARWLYIHRGERTHVDEILAESGLDTTEVIDDSAFLDLLTIQPDSDGRLMLSGFRHETIGEYLIGHDILQGFERGGYAVNEALEWTVGDDVNSFVRSGMLEASPRRLELLLDNLSDRYHELLSTNAESISMSADIERAREQILYYIGRLPVQTLPSVLTFAYENEPASLLRRSAALGAILHGDDIIEADYIDRLEDTEEAHLNRSVQMVYFGDVHADLHTFRESGQEWTRTRRAIFWRLKEAGRRDIRLRWWDLRTLRSFMSSRGYMDHLTESERSCLESLDLSKHGTSERIRRIQCELDQLLNEMRQN